VKQVSVLLVNNLENPDLFNSCSWFSIDQAKFVRTYLDFLYAVSQFLRASEYFFCTTGREVQ